MTKCMEIHIYNIVCGDFKLSSGDNSELHQDLVLLFGLPLENAEQISIILTTR